MTTQHAISSNNARRNVKQTEKQGVNICKKPVIWQLETLIKRGEAEGVFDEDISRCVRSEVRSRSGGSRPSLELTEKTL